MSIYSEADMDRITEDLRQQLAEVAADITLLRGKLAYAAMLLEKRLQPCHPVDNAGDHCHGGDEGAAMNQCKTCETCAKHFDLL